MSSTPQLSSRDVTLLAFAFQSLKDDSVLQIDYAKLAELAGYKTAASACACFCAVKKKLMGSASVDAATGPSPKKSKGKAGANGDAEDDDEVSPKKPAPKKRGKAIKNEPADAEGADADTEVTPAAETPKKARAKKGTAPSNTDLNGDGPNDTAAPEATTPTPKRKRGPNKPKDPNATPTKRAKKAANAAAPSTGAHDANDDAANLQLPGDELTTQTYVGSSIFGGDDNVKNEQEDGHDRLYDAEGQTVADDSLHY